MGQEMYNLLEVSIKELKEMVSALLFPLKIHYLYKKNHDFTVLYIAYIFSR